MMANKIKVLLVDDQSLILDILTKGLNQDSGIEVIATAKDGIEAMRKVMNFSPDVIVLDMEMPNMNGLQFLHKQMSIKPIPTILLSAVTGKDSKITNDAFEAGAVDFLQKPSGGPMGINLLIKQLWTKIKIAATQDVSQFKKSITKNIQQQPTNLHIDRDAKVNQIILGMGAYEVTNDATRRLKIFALGSCIGLALFSPKNHIVALAHVVLPTSSTDEEKAKNQPGYFADSAIRAMLRVMHSHGCGKNDIFAKIAGGAKTRVDIGDYFGVGQRNHLAVKAGLMKYGIKIVAEDVGDDISRTVWVEAGDDNLNLHHPEKGTWQI